LPGLNVVSVGPCGWVGAAGPDAASVSVVEGLALRAVDEALGSAEVGDESLGVDDDRLECGVAEQSRAEQSGVVWCGGWGGMMSTWACSLLIDPLVSAVSIAVNR